MYSAIQVNKIQNVVSTWSKSKSASIALIKFLFATSDSSGLSVLYFNVTGRKTLVTGHCYIDPMHTGKYTFDIRHSYF